MDRNEGKRKLRDKVEYCLKNFQETRDSDIALVVKVWRVYHGIGDTLNVSELEKLPSEAEVGRIRRKFNENGLYVTSNWKIAKGRGMAEEDWKKFLGYGKNVGLFAEKSHPESSYGSSNIA